MAEYAITYGKAVVPVYRHRPDGLLAARITVEVFGDNFLPSYTEGDNSMVVATDSIKNLVLRESGTWTGTTLEGLLHHLGGILLADYPQMASLLMSAEEIPFSPLGGAGVLFAAGGPEHAVARMRLERDGPAVRIAELACGRHELSLLKLRGSAFTAFVRDGYTTLPERRDRPLFVGLDVGWRYADPREGLGGDPERYVAPDRAAALVAAVFEGFVSESIQHLVHEMGVRVLERFPGLSEVSFAARNLTRDPVVEGVYTDPFPAHGTITLTMRR